MDKPEQDRSHGVIATNHVEAIVAALLLAVGIVVIVESRRLGSEWTSDGPGSGYFPFYIGLIITVSSVATLVQALFGKRRNRDAFVDREQLGRVVSVLLPAAVYIGLIMVLGIYVASAIYIALFMIVLGKYSWLRSVLIGVVVNTIFFLMFEVWFKVPLYKGALHPLEFLGY